MDRLSSELRNGNDKRSDSRSKVISNWKCIDTEINSHQNYIRVNKYIKFENTMDYENHMK